MASYEAADSNSPINVTEFLCSWVEYLTEEDIVGHPEPPETYIATALGVAGEVVAELEEVCGCVLRKSCKANARARALRAFNQERGLWQAKCPIILKNNSFLRNTLFCSKKPIV